MTTLTLSPSERHQFDLNRTNLTAEFLREEIMEYVDCGDWDGPDEITIDVPEDLANEVRRFVSRR